MKIAFWNIDKRDLSDLLVEFVNENEVDILILAEAKEDTVLQFIKKQQLYNPRRKFSYISGGKTSLLSVYNSSVFKKNNNVVSPRWSAFLVEIPSVISINLFCIHFHSKVNWSDDSLALECVNLAKEIEIVESKNGIEETLLIGDFNMNPYESGLVAANGLHALPDLNHISSKPNGRKIDGVNYKYFYNPMWNFFGDNIEPFGTYYYREPGHVSREWNIYDQIIYRPSLAKHINTDKVSIIDKVGGIQLVTALNRPDRNNYSDHLPIELEILT